MTSFKQRIADVLLSQKIASKVQLDDVMAEAAHNGKSFARLLIARGIMSQEHLTQLLSKELSLPMISLSKYRLDSKIASLIPERLARQYGVIALAKFGPRLVVAVSDPLNIFAIDDLKAFTQDAIDPVLSSRSEEHTSELQSQR